MKYFLTGATGYIGSAIAEELLAAGHTVAGLSRSSEAEQTLKSRGVTPVAADLKAPSSLKSAVQASDGVIHAGTTNDGRADTDAIRAMLEALKGTNKLFIYTSGIWLLGNTGDTPATEEAPLRPVPIVAWRPAVEQMVMGAASEGIRTVVIRPAMVYGRGGGLAGLFVQSAMETGTAQYIGDGQNRWPMVHVEDLAGLYVRASEKAQAGSLFHGADGSAYRTGEIAEAASFGAGGAGKTASLPVAEAERKFGKPLVEALLLDQVVSGEKAKSELGWTPRALPLLDDLRFGSYAMARINP